MLILPKNERSNLFCLLFCFSQQTKQIRWFVFWEILQRANPAFGFIWPLEVTSGFISKLMKKKSRWRHHWNIWHWSVKTKISPLFGHPQGSQGCQKMHHYPPNLDLEVWGSNIQSKLKKLWNSTKNQSFFMASGGFLKFLWWRRQELKNSGSNCAKKWQSEYVVFRVGLLLNQSDA